VLGLPAMPADWNEATLSWDDVPNLKPLDEYDEVNATRHNFIRCSRTDVQPPQPLHRARSASGDTTVQCILLPHIESK